MGGSGEEAEAAVQDVQAEGPAFQVIRVVTKTRKPQYTVVHYPRRCERCVKSLTGMARRN